MTAARKHTFDRQTEYLLTAWGNALRSGWNPRLDISQNVLARFIPQKGAPMPDVDDETLDKVHTAFAGLYDHHKNCAVAVWLCYVAPGTIQKKLNKLRLHGHDWSKGQYDDCLRMGRMFMRGRLT